MTEKVKTTTRVGDFVHIKPEPTPTGWFGTLRVAHSGANRDPGIASASDDIRIAIAAWGKDSGGTEQERIVEMAEPIFTAGGSMCRRSTVRFVVRGSYAPDQVTGFVNDQPFKTVLAPIPG